MAGFLKRLLGLSDQSAPSPSSVGQGGGEPPQNPPSSISFPSGIPVPRNLQALSDWCEEVEDDNFYPCIRLYFEKPDNVASWFGDKNNPGALFAVTQLAPFATGPDGSNYAIWRAPQGGFPIVFLGSEGETAVISADFDGFLAWLGARDTAEYAEDDDDDDDQESEREYFREWMESIGLTPAADSEDFAALTISYANFTGWVEEAVAGTLDANSPAQIPAPLPMAELAPGDDPYAALEAAIGTELYSDEAAQLFALIGKTVKPASPSNERSIECQSAGLELRIEADPKHRSLWPPRKQGRVYLSYVVCIWINPAFPHALPFGLKFTDSLDKVRSLGEPVYNDFMERHSVDLPCANPMAKLEAVFDDEKLSKLVLCLIEERDHITAYNKSDAYVEDSFFASWATLNGLTAADRFDAAVLTRLGDRSITPMSFLTGPCNSIFWSGDLGPEAEEFVRCYYGSSRLPEEQTWRHDIDDIFGETNYFRREGEVRTPDNWESYDRIAPRIAQRWQDWQSGKLVPRKDW